MPKIAKGRRSALNRSLPWIGALIGAAALAWVLRGFDFTRFRAVVANADLLFVLLVPLTIIVEQIVRGWKWRQLLWPLRQIGSLYLFGAVMAGYLLAIVVPFGFGTVARSWLVARRENLRFTTVLATVALDRLTDGVVFACLVPAAVLFAAFPDPGGVRTGLIWGGSASLVLFAALLAGLAIYRRQALDPAPWLTRHVDRLPSRLALPLRRVAASFAEGIIWPREAWRGNRSGERRHEGDRCDAVRRSRACLQDQPRSCRVPVPAGVPGLSRDCRAFCPDRRGLHHRRGIRAEPVGVPQEEALAMSLIVQMSSVLSVAGVGALALWLQGVALADMRADAEGAVNVRPG